MGSVLFLLLQDGEQVGEARPAVAAGALSRTAAHPPPTTLTESSSIFRVSYKGNSLWVFSPQNQVFHGERNVCGHQLWSGGFPLWAGLLVVRESQMEKSGSGCLLGTPREGGISSSAVSGSTLDPGTQGCTHVRGSDTARSLHHKRTWNVH